MVSARGDVYAWDYSMSLEITVRSSSGPNAIVALASQLDRVYSVQNQRATLYTNTGAIAFRLDPARSLNGLKINSFVYPDVANAAMVTTLKINVDLSMQAEETGNAAELLDFREQIDFGGGLPRYVYLPRARGKATRQLAQAYTPYLATQSGMAIGRRARPSPPAYAFPNADVVDIRIGKISPTRLRPGIVREFTTTWSYTFISNDQLTAEPTIIA